MTSIEVEEYLASQGMPEKQARATALAMEKFVDNGKPVSEKRVEEIVESKSDKLELNIKTHMYALFFAQLVMMAKGFGFF